MTRLIATGIAALLLAGCSRTPELTMDDAWVRLPAVAGRPAVAYFTIHGGPAPATLISAYSDVSTRSEMHQSMTAGGMASMRALNRIAVPAASDTRFQPGGRHLMLFGVNPVVKPGRYVTLTLTFADGRRLVHGARVIGAGDPPPDAE